MKVMTLTTPSFGNRLKALREKNGLTQEKLAVFVGVSLKTIQRWEKNERQPKVEDIKALAKALGVSEAQLLNDDSPSLTGEWVIEIRVCDHYEEEVIDLTGNIQPVSLITASPDGCAFTIKAPWSMLQTKAGLEELFQRILKEHYSALRGNGISLGQIPKDKKKGKKSDGNNEEE